MRVLIVDGYNVIHAWPALRALIDSHDLEEARRQLIDALASYSASSGISVTVVFDAHSTHSVSAPQVSDGVTVRFGTKVQTADHLIERLAYKACRDGAARDVVVATSDRLQQDLVVAMGVSTMSAGALEEEVVRTAQDRPDQPKGDPDAKRFRRLEDQLDPSVREKLERLRRGE